jgi:hypothetical protein
VRGKSGFGLKSLRTIVRYQHFPILTAQHSAQQIAIDGIVVYDEN